MNALESRLTSRLHRRDHVQGLHERLLAERGEGNLSETDKSEIATFRSEIAELDTEIAGLQTDLEAHNLAVKRSAELRKAMLGSVDGIDEDEDGVVYRTMAAYARDVILTGNGRVASQIQTQYADKQGIEAAQARLQLLKRTPANTLSSNVAGLTPDQHIAQIFQVIQTRRPIVESAQRADLERGVLSYPVVATRPVVAVQSTQKTEAGNTGMVINMATSTASTYLGGGDLSWQAINWSSPNALDMWFRLVASDYALKTEQDAAQAMQHSGFSYNITTTLAALTDFNDILTAIAAGAGDVYANSGRMANAVYMDPTAFYAIAGLSGPDHSYFVNSGQFNLAAQGGSVGGLDVIVSRGMDAGVIVVGDREGLLVAETAGAPVELRVVEPAIGGLEVGLIGAFEAVVVDAGAFAMITTAS